nr:hypothetical protein [Lachnospiraceae bacterium]
MNIVTTLNKKYIPYTSVMLISAAINNNVHIDVFLLSSELDDADIKLMESAVKEYDMTLHLLKVDKNRFSERLPIYENYWSIEVYYRFLLTEIMPENLERALYLDGDIIVNKSIKDFYNMSFDGNDLIACADKTCYTTKKQNEMLAEAFNTGYRYFNSGVMLMNMDQIREMYDFQSYMDAVT